MGTFITLLAYIVFCNVLKISISFPTSVLVISHSAGKYLAGLKRSPVQRATFWRTMISTEQNSHKRSRIYSTYARTHVKFIKDTLAKKDKKKLSKLQSIFFGYKDFLRITWILTKLSEIQHSEKYEILFQLQRIGKVTKRTRNGKLYFSIYKHYVFLRFFSV